MFRPAMILSVALALLMGGCRTGSVAPSTEGGSAQGLPVAEIASADADGWCSRFGREHPALACALGVGIAVGMASLAIYLLTEDGKDGQVTPLPWIQAGP